MNVERRFKRSAYKRVLELAQAHEQATPDSPTKRALSAALDAIAMPPKDPKRPAGRVIPLASPRPKPARGEAELRAWYVIGKRFVETIEELDIAIEDLHQCLAKLAPGAVSKFGIEWQPYKARPSGRERGLLKPVFFKANRKARSLPAGGERIRRFVVSEIPLESLRANLAHGDVFRTPERVEVARQVLAELRTVLTLREELVAVVNATITRAGYWERPGRGGQGAALDAILRVAKLKFVADHYAVAELTPRT